MSRGAGEVKIFVSLVAILRTQIPNLPEVVAEAKCCTLFEIETFLPDFRLIYDLKLDVALEVGRPQLFAEASEDGLASALNHCTPILLRVLVKVSNGYINTFKGERQLNVGRYGKLEVL